MAERNPLDKSDFRSMILGTPDQLAIGFRLAEGIKIDAPFTALVLSGMGGSALPGDLLRTLLGEHAGRVPIIQNRSYGLGPLYHVPGALHVVLSYSGNTEETLESFEAASAAGYPLVAVSAGGKLEERAAAVGVPHVRLPIPQENFQPRMGTGYFLGVLLEILVNHGLIPDIKSELLSAMEDLKARMPELEERGKALSQKLSGRTPVLYASEPYRGLAMVGKIKLNENAKTPAFYNAFPELNHNEMVGFTLPQADFTVLMFRDPADHARLNRRFDLTAELLREKGVQVEVIDMEGERVYNKVFTTLALLDFASYFLALSYGQDPTPVDMVEALKGKLAA